MQGRLYRATVSRLAARLYDPLLEASERAGLAAQRRALLAQAYGRTLELGAGTGRNLAAYPPAVSELVLIEPGEHMAARLHRTLNGGATGSDRPPARVLSAPAEALPLPDASMDTAVATLVLCTVADPAAALGEVARVLVPGSRLLFLEHVRSPEPARARRQDRLAPLHRFFADGCNCNRDTVALLDASPLEIERLELDRLPKAAEYLQPLIVGSARRP
jgi:SAM-dependent methyltransferase